MAPYLEVVAELNPAGELRNYPGSPLICAALLRPQDRLIACELEPRSAALLSAALRGERRAKVLAIDGWTALGAYVPPKERRGLVLIDPPYEEMDEFLVSLTGLRRLPQVAGRDLYGLVSDQGSQTPDTLARGWAVCGRENAPE